MEANYCSSNIVNKKIRKVEKPLWQHIFIWSKQTLKESIRDFGSVIYIDSSIRFKSGDLKPLFSVLPRTGMLTQFIGLKLTSYTDPKMFDWFGETADSYKGFFTIEANIFMFHDTFLTALMIKAWVTCALVCCLLLLLLLTSLPSVCKCKIRSTWWRYFW